MKQTQTQKQIVQSIATTCLSVRIRMMNRKVGAIFDESLRIHGIRASQLNILVAVSAFDRVTSYQLCKMLHMDTSTLSRALARLRKKKWLQVDPSGEGKILKIGITQEGLKKIEQVYPDWKRAQAKATKVLGESTSDMIISSGNKHLLGGMTV